MPEPTVRRPFPVIKRFRWPSGLEGIPEDMLEDPRATPQGGPCLGMAAE